MIVKIQAPAANIKGAVAYNERKMTGKEGVLNDNEVQGYLNGENLGHVVATRNVPTTSTLEQEFKRLILQNKKKKNGHKVKNPTFHMSINPGIDDKPLSEEEITRLTDELMTRLGYGEVPYKIFRHDDTGRTHYHVVGIRIGQDGKQICDSFENMRKEKICHDMEERYGFTYGLEGSEYNKRYHEREKEIRAQKEEQTASSVEQNVKKGKEPDEKKRSIKKPENGQKQPSQKEYVKPFDKKSEKPVVEQIRQFHQLTMQWSFTTPEQYAAIMRCRYRTSAELFNEKMTYAGMSAKGRKITANIPGEEMKNGCLQEIVSKCNSVSMGEKRSQRTRVETIANETAAKAKDWESFKRGMEKKGIYTVLSWNKEGKPFGVTWLDRATKCAWKGSQTDVNMAWLLTQALEKNWKITPEKNIDNTVNSATSQSTRQSKDNISHYHEHSEIKKLEQSLMPISQPKPSTVDASKEHPDMDAIMNRLGDKKKYNREEIAEKMKEEGVDDIKDLSIFKEDEDDNQIKI